jgi:ubiquinone biosynthesis protein Coq4
MTLPLEKAVHGARFGWSFLRLTADLGRLDDVFTLNAHLIGLGRGSRSEDLVSHYVKTREGAAAVQERRRLRLDPGELAGLRASTLGGAYARFLKERGLAPESFPDLPVKSDVDYIVAHLYETHDLWHVVTGFDTDPAGEAGLQAFYLAQQRSYLPFFVLSAVLMNTALFAYDEKERRLDALTSGWTLGKHAVSLFGFDWRVHLERPLVDVQRELLLSGPVAS